ncbi:MAG: hypothetical protein G01um101431_1044 [Parcubacteria group bacterium Gr01-1014_31]|nr:MAG: hypothetical protein G01um101431_1044 [Parcubacteria group bacterium Gr01-1014_31]
MAPRQMMNNLSWAMLHPLDYLRILHFCRRVKDYHPQKVHPQLVLSWLDQFPKTDHHLILSLLSHIRYYSEQKTEDVLVKHNGKLLAKLQSRGVALEKVIYVTVDKPASSSHLMLNLLRDKANLERKRVHIIDCQNLLELIKTTISLGSGAIIYVDDFSGTGDQFLNSRNYVAKEVPLIGQFSEFFLLPCICREAFAAITKVGVEIVCDYIHDKNDRPLHPDSIILDDVERERLVGYCREGDRGAPLGYRGLASMVVFYRNTPNGVPSIFRGNVGQDSKFGIFPRITDLVRG